MIKITFRDFIEHCKARERGLVSQIHDVALGFIEEKRAGYEHHDNIHVGANQDTIDNIEDLRGLAEKEDPDSLVPDEWHAWERSQLNIYDVNSINKLSESSREVLKSYVAAHSTLTEKNKAFNLAHWSMKDKK